MSVVVQHAATCMIPGVVWHGQSQVGVRTIGSADLRSHTGQGRDPAVA